MLIDISPKHQQTEQYLRHIYTDILSKMPILEGELLEIQITEGLTPFPKISEFPTLPEKDVPRVNQKLLQSNVRTVMVSAERTTNQGQIQNKRWRQTAKATQLIGFTDNALRSIGKMETSIINNLSPLEITLSYIITNPKAIFQNAKRLGLDVSAHESNISKKKSNVPQYSKDPPHIMWLGKKISIPYDSMQHGICNVVFEDMNIKTHSWDKVFDKVNGAEPQNPEKGRRTIYDAVSALNKRIKEKTGKELFEWEEKSFRRIA